MAEIKEEIESKDFVFVSDFTDTPMLKRLLECHDELSANNCKLVIHEQERIISRDILLNLLQMHKEIEEEVRRQIDAEADD